MAAPRAAPPRSPPAPRRPRLLLPLLLPLLLSAPSDGERPGRLRTEPRKGREGCRWALGADLARAARTCRRTRGGRVLPEKGSRAGQGGAGGEGTEAGGRAGRGMLRTEPQKREPALRLQDSRRTRARTEK